ncbi:HSP20-like chaperone [Paxillus ammoniavirescens]|nr:HSP20-like chaperone [Paxillus ammoniavirescens]
MSIARILHEFRPLFRMLEEPLGRTPAAYGLPHRSFLPDPLLTSPSAFRPAVDVTEEGDTYIVETDLPGVKKENVDVTIGDGGRSITIQGRTLSRRGEEAAESAPEAGGAQGETPGALVNSEATSNQLTSERLYTGSAAFMRTVWLPQPVDPSKVSAKLADGILTLKVSKIEDHDSVKVAVE